jgi:hypothetical protein
VHEVTVTTEGASVKTSIVQLLVKLQYLPATPAEQKEIIDRVSTLLGEQKRRERRRRGDTIFTECSFFYNFFF